MNDKLKVSILICIILICLGLSFKMIMESSQYSCDKCEIRFKSARFGSTDYQLLTYSVQELFDRYAAGYCSVSWDRVNGYITQELER